jgi:P-loop Domain of unknown function (DUF2791)
VTATITTAKWAEFIQREYLESFIREGGAAIKFCVPMEEEARSSAWNALSQMGHQLGYVVAGVNAVETRLNLADQWFFRIAQQIDWPASAERVVKGLCERAGYKLPDASAGSFYERVAEENGIEANIVKVNLERALGQEVSSQRTLARDFRIAMTQLCLAQLRGGADAPVIAKAITDWLTGRNPNVNAVKPYQIFSRVTRTNARRMLESLIRWVAISGLPGTLLLLDVARLAIAKNPRDGRLFYTTATLLDTYEVMREFIDSTDRLAHCLIAIFPAPSFLDETDGSRGMVKYEALKLRIVEDVRAREVVNPMAALVRLSTNAP